VTRSVTRPAARALCALVLASTAASAQRVVGTVRDSIRGGPVAGVVAIVVDSRGGTLARTISDRSGVFRVPIEPAAAAIQIRRIGFRPRDIRLPDSAHTSTVSIPIALEPVVQLLDPVVSDGDQCPRSARRSRAQALWEQAQLGLLASVVARDASPATVRFFKYNRVEGGGTRVVPTQTVTLHQVYDTRTFRTGRSPEDLVARGYMTVAPASTVAGGVPATLAENQLFEAPDADILLHPSFRQTHCLDLADADAAHRGQIGIAFTPHPGRDTLVDIAGTLWLVESPLALSVLDFRYVGSRVSVTAARARTGGDVQFRTADNGIVFSDRWLIRLAPYPLRTTNPLIETTGAELLSARWGDSTSVVRTFGTIEGRVVDRATKEGLRGIAVSIPVSPYHTRTGDDGAFTLTDVVAGPYLVEVSDISYSAFGVDRSARRRLTLEDNRLTVNFELEALASLVDARCRDSRIGRGADRLLGRVLDSRGRPVMTTRVEVTVTAAPPAMPITRMISTDDGGRFAICGIPAATVSLVAINAVGSNVAQLTFRGTGVIDTVTIRR
jgi:hypothetical protein